MIPMTSAFGAKSSHRLCLLRPPNLCPLLLGTDLRSGRRAGLSLSAGLVEVGALPSSQNLFTDTTTTPTGVIRPFELLTVELALRVWMP